MTRKEAATQFKKLFEQFAHTQSYSNAFNDFLDTALLLMKRAEFWDEEDKRVAQRLESGRDGAKYGPIVAQMILLYGEISENDGEGFYDGLGDMFMELVSHGHNGQFFTPQEVCDMMALLTYGGTELTQGERHTVCDPACGSGRTLLAMAKLNRKNLFYGADVDLTCVKMTVLNMLTNTMEGEVAWMNTLSMDHYRSYHINKMLLENGNYLPYYYTTGKNQTNFVERIKKSLQPEEPVARGPITPVALVGTPKQSGEQLKMF